MDYEEWLTKAETSIAEKVRVGKRFETRDLFESVEWEELSKGDRIQFGRVFSDAVKEGKFPNIERVQRGDNNHTRYVKVRD